MHNKRQHQKPNSTLGFDWQQTVFTDGKPLMRKSERYSISAKIRDPRFNDYRSVSDHEVTKVLSKKFLRLELPGTCLCSCAGVPTYIGYGAIMGRLPEDDEPPDYLSDYLAVIYGDLSTDKFSLVRPIWAYRLLNGEQIEFENCLKNGFDKADEIPYVASWDYLYQNFYDRPLRDFDFSKAKFYHFLRRAKPKLKSKSRLIGYSPKDMPNFKSAL